MNLSNNILEFTYKYLYFIWNNIIIVSFFYTVSNKNCPILLEINYLFDIRISIDVFKLDFQIKKKMGNDRMGTK